MTEVISLNLTDLPPDGQSDPITERILELATAAARVVKSDADLVGARVALAATRRAVAADLPHLAGLLDAVQDLLSTVEAELGGA